MKVRGGLKGSQSVRQLRKPGFEQISGDWPAKFDYDRKKEAFNFEKFGDIAPPNLAFDTL